MGGHESRSGPVRERLRSEFRLRQGNAGGQDVRPIGRPVAEYGRAGRAKQSTSTRSLSRRDTTLDLNDLHLYARTAQISGTILNGHGGTDSAGPYGYGQSRCALPRDQRCADGHGHEVGCRWTRGESDVRLEGQWGGPADVRLDHGPDGHIRSERGGPGRSRRCDYCQGHARRGGRRG